MKTGEVLGVLAAVAIGGYLCYGYGTTKPGAGRTATSRELWLAEEYLVPVSTVVRLMDSLTEVEEKYGPPPDVLCEKILSQEFQ